MRIAILSDVHENFHNLILALESIRNTDCEKIIFLWDFINAWIAKLFAYFPAPTFAVWWNNDWDKCTITKVALGSNSNLEISNNVYDFLEIDWKRIFITHFADLAKPMAKSWEYDLVLYWHNHEKNIDKIWNCIILNPGEISAHKTWNSTFAIFDTKTSNIEMIELENIVTTKTELSDEYKSDVWLKFNIDKSRKY